MNDFYARKHEEKLAVKSVVYARENGRCFYCDMPLEFDIATLDHIIPKSLGEPLTIGNTVLACFECNNERGDYPADIYLTLKLTGGFPK